MVKVIVYSTPTCPQCNAAKSFLKENDIDFEEVDLSVNQEEAKRVVEITKQMHVPIIQLDEEYISGFDKEKIKEILGI